MTILTALNEILPSLSKAEAKVAEAILADPEAAVGATTADLAKLASVSDPMVSRFCRTLGCKSFPDFKIQLARSLVSESSFIGKTVSLDDDATHYIEKRINANQSALEYIRQQLRVEVVEAAVTLLKNAKRIEVFGMGGAAAIALDAQNKLFRLGIPTMASSDYLMQRMVAAAANKDSTLLLLSFTGRTREMNDIARIALDNGAKIIAITSPDSPLAELSHVTIPSGDELEDTRIYVPMTIRIVVLTIVDILATGLALAQGPRVYDQLKKIKDSLDATKVT